jgi:hypothetical protein
MVATPDVAKPVLSSVDAAFVVRCEFKSGARGGAWGLRQPCHERHWGRLRRVALAPPLLLSNRTTLWQIWTFG